MPSTLGVVSSSFYSLWTPEAISTVLWLDASDASTITESSGSISSWSDKKNNGRSAVQETGLNQPTYTSSGLNGKNVVTFNGTSSWLSVADTYDAPINIYVVVKSETTSGVRHILRKGFNAGNSFEFFLRTNDLTVQLAVGGSSSAFVSSATNQATTDATIYGSVNNGEILRLFKNGSAIGNTPAITTAQLNSTQALRIGASPSDNTSGGGSAIDFWNGIIAEVVLTTAILSTEDRQNIEGYLAHKWGLTSGLPAEHPFKTVAPKR